MRSIVRMTLAALSGAALAAGSMTLQNKAVVEAPRPFEPSGFTFEVEIEVPGTPGAVFDAFTGDVLPWWDHHVSLEPEAMFIEPRPGGSFMELFDERGNGIQHARVTGCDRGKWLRMVGPLGLAGGGVELEMSFTFVQVADGTKLKLVVHAQGNVQPEMAKVVQQVWRHFLIERFQPYATDKLRSR